MTTQSDFERGRQQGMKQERALWELARSSEEIEAVPVEVALWQYRWLNPTGDVNRGGQEWKEPEPVLGQSMESKIDELLSYTYQGKPMYEVRALYAAQPAQAGVDVLREPAEYVVREYFNLDNSDGSGCHDAMKALRLALRQPKQAPKGES